jgi:hypothetical protein
MRPGQALRRRGHNGWRLSCATVATAAMIAATAGTLTGCTAALSHTVPGCGDPLRLAIIAQSVPGAAYIPCIRQLPPGWSASAFDPARGRTRFTLTSDLAPATPVVVQLAAACKIDGATPSPSRAAGVQTYTRLPSITPRLVGSLYDVFRGGCVSYSFSFDRQQYALIEQFESAVGLYSRQQLRLTLKKKLGVELSP